MAQAFTDFGGCFLNYEEFFISDIESSSVDGTLHFVGEYTNLDELNIFAEKLAELKESKTQQIDIHFNFIGEVSLPTIEERRKHKKSFARTKKEDQIALAI